MANFLPFKLSKSGKENNYTFKGITGTEDLHTDADGKHLIFRTVNGRVTPIRVGAEDFSEWLVNQGVNINPADQKTLREIDRELEIMERAADYGGPKLQKQYEDYFKQRRETYSQLALQYYQQAIQAQSQRTGATPEAIIQTKEQMIRDNPAMGRRESMERRGWKNAFFSWVQNSDYNNKLTPADDQWYYNRIYGCMMAELAKLAEKKVPLASLDIGNLYSDEFIKLAIQNNYDVFFGGQGTDSKKAALAVRRMQKDYADDAHDTRNAITNFASYWYDKMTRDFAREDESMLGTSSVTDALRNVPENVVPETLPTVVNKDEANALMGMYNSAQGSKLNASHRVLLHGMGRLVESIPLKERVMMAVELSKASTGLNAVHKEGYKRIYTDALSLGMIPNRDDLVREALDVVARISAGSTAQKIAALKKVALIMGQIDGLAVLNSNPGIQETQFTRKWHDSAINAGRIKSEGPGLIDILLDDDRRDSHIYSNKDLRIVHADGVKKPPEKNTPQEPPTPQATVPEAAASSEQLSPSPATETTEIPLISDDEITPKYQFKASEMILPNGYRARFGARGSDYLEVSVYSSENENLRFDARVPPPPMELSKMTNESRASYIDNTGRQLEEQINRYLKSLRKAPDEVDTSPETGTFRLPLFDFKDNLTSEDRDFLGEVITYVDEGNLEVKKLLEGAYRVTNPANNKSFDILMSKAKKRLVGMFRDIDGKVIPFTEPNIQDFAASLEYRTSV